MWDDNKYVAQVTQEFASNEPKPSLSNAQMKAMMKFIEDGKGSIVKGKLDNYELTDQQKDAFKKIFMVSDNI